MASLRDLRNSKFLKREDVGVGVLVTISKVEPVNVAKDGADPEMKYAVYFDELEKPLVLNATNGEIIAGITGHEDDIERNWLGVKVVLYDDPNVFYSGKKTGGIRVRAPRNQPAKPKPEPVKALPSDDDSMPF